MKDRTCALGARPVAGADRLAGEDGCVPEAAAAAPTRGPAIVGRRVFAAGAVAAGLAALGVVVRPAHAGSQYEDPDVVKQTLQAIKDLACTLAGYVDGLEGPLQNPVHLAWVENNIIASATEGQKLLNIPSSLLFSPPTRWLYWMPIDAMGMNLTEVADNACQAACDALEAWCAAIEPGGTAEDEEQAAESLWKTQNLYCHLFCVAGIQG